MEPPEKWDITSYAEDLAANIRAARARADLSQQMLAARMRRLGFSSWVYQTVGKVEHANRPVTAPEILGLALAMSTTIFDLMHATPSDHLVGFPGYGKDHKFNGISEGSPAKDVDVIGAKSVTASAYGIWDRPIWWADEGISAVFILSFGDSPDRITSMDDPRRHFISRPPAKGGEEKP